MARREQNEAAGVDPTPSIPRAYRLAFGAAVLLFGASAAAGLGQRALVERSLDAHFRFLDEADALLAAGEYARAAEKYRAAVAIPQGDSHAAWRLATALEGAGDPAGTAEALREVLRFDPGHRRARVHLGMALARAGRADEAIAELAPLVAGARVEPDAVAATGYAHLRAGRRAEATAHAERALALDPANGLAREVQSALAAQPTAGAAP